MYPEDILLPFFCSHCHQLAFILKKVPSEPKTIVEFDKGSWKHHFCHNLKGDAIWSHDPDLPDLDFGCKQIKVNFPQKQKKPRDTKLSKGVIIEIPEKQPEVEVSAPVFLKVATLEGHLVHVRSSDVEEIKSAGLLIDLSEAKRVGNEKFRLPNIKIQKVLVEDPNKYEGDFGSYFSFTLAANDQEQLESFIDRFLKVLSKDNLYLQSIIPLEIKSDQKQSVYQRRLTVESAFKLQKTIKSFAFPEYITVTIH